jgi:uncharacterized protein
VSARPTEFLDRVADDCVWTVGGSSAVAGEYRGRDEVLAFFRRLNDLTDGTHAVELLWEVDDGERAVAYQRVRGTRPDGRSIDLDQAIVCRLEGGMWSEVRALPFDQRIFDAFWA